MAVEANALTLSEWAMISNDPLVTEITKSLHQTWNALKDIPLKTSPALKQMGVRYTGASNMTINWAEINELPVAVKDKPTPYEDSLYMVRNKIQVDHVLLDQPNAITDPVESQLMIFLESFAYDFNDKFINNKRATGDKDCFDGIRYRLENRAQYDIPADCVIDAGGATASLSNAQITATTANIFIMKVQELLDGMNSPDGDGVVLYMNEDLKRRFELAIRILGAGAGFDITKDNFDRPVEKYKAATIRPVGRKADQTTHIITSTETAAGVDGASTFTSMYAVRYGKGYASGWQTGPFKPTYLGLSKEDGVMHNIVFDWGVGLWIPHTRALGRLYDIKVS